MNLREKGAGTRIRLEHFGIPTIKPGQYAVADFWSLSMDNLRAWVERKEVGLRCDFGTVKLGDVQLEVDIAAAPEEVFSNLLDPERLSKYVILDPVAFAAFELNFPLQKRSRCFYTAGSVFASNEHAKRSSLSQLEI